MGVIVPADVVAVDEDIGDSVLPSLLYTQTHAASQKWEKEPSLGQYDTGGQKKTVPNADSGKVKMINGEILFCLLLKWKKIYK